MNGLQPENRSSLIAMLNAPPGAVGLDQADAQLRDYLGTAPVSSTGHYTFWTRHDLEGMVYVALPSTSSDE